jgi:tetratricopeptide (TPR) repeat protein
VAVVEQRRVCAGAVPPLANGFIARTETGQDLRMALVPGATVTLVSARAVGVARDWPDSCGKTQLAAAFALSSWQDDGVDVLVWVNAKDRASVLSAYAEAAAAIGIQPQPQPAGDAESVAVGFVGWLRDTARPWLVVLDDLTDAAALDRLWPAGPAGRILITTTNPATLPDSHRGLVIPVGSFSRREALTYLTGRLTSDLDQRQGAVDLVNDLGDEPLALAQASAVIATSELTCREYGEHFARRRQQVIAPDGGKPSSAAITWTLSIEHADLLAPGSAQPLLVLAALLDGSGIPGTIFTTSTARAYSAAGSGGPLDALEQAGLLWVDTATTPVTVRVNWAVQAAVRAAMPGGMLSGAAKAAADALLEAWPADGLAEWHARSLRSCADNLRRVAGNLLWQDGCHPLLLHAGHSMDAARLAGPAIGYWGELAAVSDRVLGREHPDGFLIHEQLARAYLAAGRGAESISWFQSVRSDRARSLGQDHPGTIEASRALGQALMTAGRFGEAIAILGDVASGYERSRGPESIEALAGREDLAAAYRAAGHFADAIVLYRRALADRERIQGARHRDTIAICQNLAETYLADGQNKAAISHYKRVLADQDRVLGPSHLETIAARGALGSAYHHAGKVGPALQLYEQARAEYERVLGADHRTTLAACMSLANAYYSVGRLTDAAKLIHDTVERCERSLPAFDPLTMAARESLASVRSMPT